MKGPGKGRTNNPNGRPKGIANKDVRALRENLAKFVESNLDSILKDFQKIDKPETRIRLFIELLKFTLPSLQAVSIEKITQPEPPPPITIQVIDSTGKRLD